MGHSREHYSRLGRIGGPASWARTQDRAARTAPAREAARTALDRRLAEEYGIPLDGSATSERRLAAARTAHFQRLAYRRARGGRSSK